MRSPAAAVRLSCVKDQLALENAEEQMVLTRSDPAKSTKWNFETTVVHSPGSSPPSAVTLSRLSGGRKPMALAGLSPPRPIPEAKLGVEGRPKVGDETLPLECCCIIDPGRARREGERPPGGSGEEERVGGPAPNPLYFFWVKVKENIACERDDCAFMSVSFVRRIDVPWRIRLKKRVSTWTKATTSERNLLHNFSRILHLHFAKTTPNDVTILILSNLDLPSPPGCVIYT